MDDVEECIGNKYIKLKEMSVDQMEWRKKSTAVANTRRKKVVQSSE